MSLARLTPTLYVPTTAILHDATNRHSPPLLNSDPADLMMLVSGYMLGRAAEESQPTTNVPLLTS